jgi:hypothetical protein
VVDSCAIPDLQQWLRDREMMIELLRQHLERQNLRMKHQADKHQTEMHFTVGDWVYLKLHPYVQKSVANQVMHKLAFRFMGLFRCWKRLARWLTNLTCHHIRKSSCHTCLPTEESRQKGYKGTPSLTYCNVQRSGAGYGVRNTLEAQRR